MPRVSMSALHSASGGAIDRLAVTRTGNHVVTVVRAASHALKVIAWDVDADGAITRRGDAAGGDVTRVAITDWSHGVVTAVRLSSGTLRVIAWTVADNGDVARAGDADGDAVSEVVVSSPPGFGGVVTASVNGDGKLEMIAWKLSSAGHFTRTDSKLAGTCSAVAIRNLNTVDGKARVAVAVRNGSGNLQLITWSITSAGQIARLKDASGGAISNVALAFHSTPNADLVSLSTASGGATKVIGWAIDDDGSLTRTAEGGGGVATSPTVVTYTPDVHTYAVGAVRTEDGHLRLIAWRNGGDMARYGEADGDAIEEVAITWWSKGVVTVARDAAGNVKLQSWRVRPAGIKLLRQQWPVPPATSPAPAPPALMSPADHVSATTTKRRKRRLKFADLEFRPGPPPPGPPPPEPGEGTGTSPAWTLRFFPGIAAYDPMLAVGHQFVIVTQDHAIRFFDRNGVLLTSKAGESTSMSATSFFAQFTATNNPDGTPNQNNINLFSEIHEFYDTRVTYDPASRRFLILSAARKEGGVSPRYIAFGVSKTEDPRDGFNQYMTTESNYRDFPRVVVHNGTVFVAHNASGLAEEGDTPILYGFDLASMQQFVEDPPNWQLFSSDCDGASRLFVALHPGQTNGLTCAFDIRRDDPVLRIAAIPAPAHPYLAPRPVLAQVTLPSQAGSPGPYGVFRNSTLYLCAQMTVTEEVPNVQPMRKAVRTVRVPFTSFTPASVVADGGGVVDLSFGKRGASDAAGDLVTYDMPHLAVNSSGDVIFVFGRTGIQTAAPLFPEARYAVWYHNQSAPRGSALLQAGGFQPTQILEGDTDPTVLTHAYKLDYATAVVDPVDDKTFWVIHEYTTTSAWASVVGVVTP